VFEFRRAAIGTALFVAFAFAEAPGAQAISCIPDGSSTPTSCTDADPMTRYPGNTPANFLNDSPALAWLKYSESTNSFIGKAGYVYNSYFDLTATSDETGNWTFDAAAALADGLPLVPTMVAIKAGSGWMFYALAAGTYSGSWDTDDRLGGKDLSHVVFYDGFNPDEGNPPIPLPGAAWLFGSVLAGLAMLGVRQRREGDPPGAPRVRA
jgi:hypothetical protein